MVRKSNFVKSQNWNHEIEFCENTIFDFVTKYAPQTDKLDVDSVLLMGWYYNFPILWSENSILWFHNIEISNFAKSQNWDDNFVNHKISDFTQKKYMFYYEKVLLKKSKTISNLCRWYHKINATSVFISSMVMIFIFGFYRKYFQ